MSDYAANADRTGFRITGWHVLAMMVTFFAVIITVNVIFISAALRTFPGEDQRRSYVQGLEYNEVIEARRAQEALGWAATVNLTDDRVLVQITDPSNSPITGLNLTGRMRHPAKLGLDQELSFTEARPGVYSAPIQDLSDGAWTLMAHSTDAETPFALEHELWRR